MRIDGSDYKKFERKQRMKLTVEKINELLGINESYKASERLMKILFNKEDRENLFKRFLGVD